MQDRISTERLTLRPVDPDRDLDAFHALCAALETTRMVGSFPHPFSRFHAEARIFVLNAQAAVMPARTFAIDDGTGLIGTIGASRGPDGWGVGYMMSPEGRGRGLMTEALGGLLAWIDARPDAAPVSACVFTDNPASARVLEKAGFERAPGVCRDWSMARLAYAPTWTYRRQLASRMTDAAEAAFA